MIPYTLLQGELHSSRQETKEIRILELSIDSFTFRLKKGEAMQAERIRLYFWSYEEAAYRTIELSSFEAVMEEEEEAACVYRVIIEDDNYVSAVRKLQKEIRDYSTWKLNEADAVLSQKMCGYPAEKENCFALPHSNCKADDPQSWEVAVNGADFGIEVESLTMRDGFLQLTKEEFLNRYWKKQRLEEHPLSKAKVRSVHFGNSFCFYALPSCKELHSMLLKAKEYGWAVTVSLPPLKERYRSSFEHLLDMLGCFAQENNGPELIVNDWGTIMILNRKWPGLFTITLGVLLNKRRKDTRLEWRIGKERQMYLLKENSLDDPDYREELRDRFAVKHAVLESCDYLPSMSTAGNIVFFPYYQLNTSGHCILYAMRKNGARSLQTQENNCPQYCRENMLVYPEHLRMFGYENTIFGVDERILQDAGYFAAFSQNGKQRMVLMERHGEGEIE